MRFFPDPWRPLHPAFVDMPAPLPGTPIALAPIFGGLFGGTGVVAGQLLGRPKIGLTVAAYTTVLYGSWAVVVSWAEGKMARGFLEAKGIDVPKRRFAERYGSFDVDNATLLGAIVGTLLARRNIRPQHMSRFSWYGGAASFGGGAFSMLAMLAPWRAKREALDRIDKSKMEVEQHNEEFIAWWRSIPPSRMVSQGNTLNTPIESPASAQAGQETNQGQASLLQVVLHGQDGQAFGASDADDNRPEKTDFTLAIEELRSESDKLDKEDPQPHLSQIDDGERVFIPETNYRWKVGSVEEGRLRLNEHIEKLKKRREDVSREAELFWHTIAAKEAEFYRTTDTSLKDQQRAALEVMNEIHLNIWLHVSMIDWMIADSSKNLLQLESMKDKSKAPWTPPLPENADKIKSKMTRKVLEETSFRTQQSRAELRETETEVEGALKKAQIKELVYGNASESQPAIEASTEQGGTEEHMMGPEEKFFREAMQHLEREAVDLDNRQKALDALIADVDRRSK